MRTTIDLEEALHRRARVAALERGESLTALIARAVAAELMQIDPTAEPDGSERAEISPPILALTPAIPPLEIRALKCGRATLRCAAGTCPWCGTPAVPAARAKRA